MRNRNGLHAAAAGLIGAALVLSACSAPETSGGDTGTSAAPDEVPDAPSEPVEIHILDVAGSQRLTQSAFESFAESNPEVISSITWESGGAPDIVGTLKPQVDSGSLSIDLVLTGLDGLASGIAEDLWVPVEDEFGDRLTNQADYLEGAADLQELGDGYGVVVTLTPSGPLLMFNPDDITSGDVPTSPEEVLEYAEANPGRFGYARPANSGPGRTWLQGLPYLLDDADPRDPVDGWDNTWAFLKELGQYVDNYPTGTGQVITNMADNTWSLTPMTMGWDIEPRADGRAPAELETAAFDDFTWIPDGHFASIPRGQSADKTAAILLMLQDMLTPEQNAKAYETGYLYPGPAVEGATLEMASQETQDLIAEFGRDWYDEAIESNPVESQLEPADLAAAFDIWDREVGAGKFEES